MQQRTVQSISILILLIILIFIANGVWRCSMEKKPVPITGNSDGVEIITENTTVETETAPVAETLTIVSTEPITTAEVSGLSTTEPSY